MVSTFLTTVMMAVMGPPTDASIIYFTAEWCGPCAEMRPILQQLEQEGVEVFQVDADQRKDLIAQFQIRNLPTLVFRSGDQEVDRMVGVSSYPQVRRRYDRTAARSGSASVTANHQQPQVLNASQSRSAPSMAPASPATTQPAGPIIRGQSPAIKALPRLASGIARALPQPTIPPEPKLTLQQAIQRAAAATVRIRVDEANTTAHGTGTIVDVHGDEALVLTCGHLFRDMTPGSMISVDLFAGTPNEINLPSQLIDFKADETDIGLISFRLPVAVEPVELLPREESIRAGQDAFSFGCDHGQAPTRRDTRITNVNRYNGPANVEIAGAPAVGRSGGGLFDSQGRLIGVCNAADANDDRGIYAGAEVVYAQVERLGMSHLFARAEPSQPAPNQALAATPVADISLATASAGRDSGVPQAATISENPAASQIICIVKGAGGQQQMVTIDRPSAELLNQIRSHAR